MRLILSLFFILLAYPVMSQPMCAPYERMVTELESRFQEARTGRGVDARGHLVEVYSSEGGSWTMLVTIPNGPSCIVATGQAWETLTPVRGEQS